MWGAWKKTGRRVDGPASDLVEVQNALGQMHTAIVFHDLYKTDSELGAGLDEVMAFLESPGHNAVQAVVDRKVSEGALIYPTGTSVSLAEVIQIYAEEGDVPGVRAALELCYLVASALHQVSDRANKFDLSSHGALTPWRILIREGGQPIVIGYGVPQVELFAFLDDSSQRPSEDSLRYVPPERMRGEVEELNSDFLALVLIATEFIVGRPVYEGLFSDIEEQAKRGNGSYKLHKWQEKIPTAVVGIFSRALKADLDSRYLNPLDFIHDLHDQLGSPATVGPSLAEVVHRVLTLQGKKSVIEAGKTRILTREQMLKMAAEGEEPFEERITRISPPPQPRPGEDANPNDGKRWGGVSRSRDSPSSADLKKDTVKKDTSGGLRERLHRSRGGRSKESTAPVSSKRAGGSDVENGLRARLRRSTSEKPSSKAGLRARLSRSSDGKSAVPDDLRTRLRRSVGDGSGSPQDARVHARRSSDRAPSTKGSERKQASSSVRERLRSSVKEGAALTPNGSKSASVETMAVSLVPKDKEASTESTASLLARLRGSVIAPSPSQTPTSLGASSALKEAPSISLPSALLPSTSPVTFSWLSGKPLSLRPTDGESPSAFVYRAVVSEGKMSFDGIGRLIGWYELSDDRGVVDGWSDRPTGSYTLNFVENTAVRVSVTVKGHEPSIRLQTFVGSAVPVGFLLSYFKQWLELGEGQWQMYRSKQRLDDTQLLGLNPGELLLQRCS